MSMGWGQSGPVATRSFSKGIWRSVYTVAVAARAAAITHLVPQVYYDGAFPTSPLTDATHGGFTVKVRVHLWAPAAVSGSVAVAGAWPGAAAAQAVSLPAGDSNVTLTLAAPPGSVSLWWPVGLGAQALYAVNASFVPSGAAPAPAPPATERRIGFKFVAYVTGNDTNPEWLAANTGGDGNANPQGLMVRANGAPLYMAGANMIPMDMMEGRYSAAAVVRLVRSAAEANMNILRVWGGGTYQSPAFYDTCDEVGLLVLHDIQYAQNGHSPKGDSPSHKAEIQHQVRRLGHHASLAIIDGCNECHVILNTSTGVCACASSGARAEEGLPILAQRIALALTHTHTPPPHPPHTHPPADATFVMQTVVDEDQSRVAWPSCPSNGWTAGVDRLSGHPNGSPLGLLPNARTPLPGAGAAGCQFMEEHDVDGDSVAPTTTPGTSAADCCAQCAALPQCASVVWDPEASGSCWFKADGGSPTPRANRTACINSGHAQKHTIEVHGPYQHGQGWPAVNGGGQQGFKPFDSGYPLKIDASVPMGPAWPSQFASEFGGSVWSSFESLAPTVAPAHWGIHGGAPPDTCGGGFETDCTGNNTMAQRNYVRAGGII
jgi:beta-mannosidase